MAAGLGLAVWCALGYYQFDSCLRKSSMRKSHFSFEKCNYSNPAAHGRNCDYADSSHG